jgi:lysine 6-dehydrogenase
MNIVVLGGGGAMGRAAVIHISRLAGVTSLIVADRDLASAEAASDAVAGGALTTSARPVDVSVPEQLADVIAGSDLVVNTVGPFYRFGMPVLEAAIAAGKRYIDICDDWEPTIEMMALHETAAASGSSCIVGMGASPGASNLLAVLACAELDEVDSLYTAWPVDVGGDADGDDEDLVPNPNGQPGAATVHWMQQISGEIRTFEKGRFVNTLPLEPVTIDAPGFGSGTVYTVGHPEPMTLAGNLGVRDRCANTMLITPGTVAFLDGLRKRIDRGELTNEEAASELERPSPAGIAKAGLRSVGRRGPGKLPLFFAYAKGRKSGHPHHATATTWLPGGMADATSIPLAIAVGEMISGNCPPAGVWAAEQAINPQRFFAALAAFAPDGDTHMRVDSGPTAK